MLLRIAVAVCLGLPCLSSTAQETETERQQLESSGQPQTFADLKTPAPESQEDNVAYWLARAETGRFAIDMALAADFEYDKFPTDQLRNTYHEVLARHPETYEYLERAAAAPACAPDWNYEPESAATFLEDMKIDELRSVARTLMYRSGMQLAEGEPDAAAHSALAILQICSHDEFVIGMMGCTVRSACMGIGLHQLSMVLQSGVKLQEETHAAIEQELARHDSLALYRQSLISERVLGLQMIRDQGAGGFALRVEPYLQTMRVAIDNAEKTSAELEDIFDGAERRSTVAAMIAPAIQHGRGSAHRILAQARCLRVINALHANMAAEPWLEGLELPESTKLDPMTGQPLKVERTGAGWTVYSVGRDLTDNGGAFDRDQDWGFEPIVFGQ
ncbi:MAG: hypothetical protein ACR2NP_12850 [Pirellulaceae bacterium]